MTDGLLLPDAAATESLGRAVGQRLRAGDVVLLRGGLGAGKTSMARAVLQALGLQSEAPSPSFSLVIEYRPPEVRLPLLHADLYRLDRPNDLDELGLEEGGGALLVEWPERAGEGRWPHALSLTLTPEGDGRRLTWAVPPSWETRWPPAP